MKRINIFLTEDQIKFINKQPQTISEIIRRALDEYINKIKSLDVSASKGGQNAKSIKS